MIRSRDGTGRISRTSAVPDEAAAESKAGGGRRRFGAAARSREARGACVGGGAGEEEGGGGRLIRARRAAEARARRGRWVPRVVSAGSVAIGRWGHRDRRRRRNNWWSERGLESFGEARFLEGQAGSRLPGRSWSCARLHK
jgi:hypothetical protein